MGSLQKKNWIHAIGRFSAATPPLVECAGTGNWSVVRAGQGLWDVTLNDPIDVTERVVLVCPRVTSSLCAVIPASDTDTNIRIHNESDAGADVDTAVDFVVLRVGG
jgi:hypothetical protein